MSILQKAVAEANEQGNLALMIYAIPNFPTPEIYQETLAILHQHPAVTIIETTFPVTSKFSPFANETIQQAHKTAAQFETDVALMESLTPFEKPSVYVLYRETLEKFGYETILQKIQGKIDALLFEWEVEDVPSFVEPSNRYGIELIQVADPVMSLEEMNMYLDLADDEPLVYLVSAEMTGATISPIDQLTECAQLVKARRPAAKTMAGFGIRTAADIEKLSHIADLDGVIIGTAFLEIMAQGTAAVKTYLDQLAPALIGAKEAR